MNGAVCHRRGEKIFFKQQQRKMTFLLGSDLLRYGN